MEGDAERFLLPTFAAALAIDLDHHGISICSVAGTHFNPYVKFLEGLQIPFVVLTDMDPMEGKEALGVARAKGILSSIASMRDSQAQKKLIGEIGKTDANSIGALAAGYGCFLNAHTLEVDLFLAGFHEVILHTLAPNFGPDRKKKLNDWNDEPRSLETDAYLAMITEVGKGRFAQQLASMCAGIRPPDYIANAIAHLVKRVQ